MGIYKKYIDKRIKGCLSLFQMAKKKQTLSAHHPSQTGLVGKKINSFVLTLVREFSVRVPFECLSGILGALCSHSSPMHFLWQRTHCYQ